MSKNKKILLENISKLLTGMKKPKAKSKHIKYLIAPKGHILKCSGAHVCLHEVLIKI